MRKVIGIDPGVTGALALLIDGTLESVIDMPVFDSEISGRLLAANIGLIAPDLVVIEQQQAMPKNGSIAGFKLGVSYGICLGVVESLSHPLIKIRPPRWKALNGLLRRPKEASRQLAIELWPDHAHQLQLVKHHNRAEAALIARAGIIHERDLNYGTVPDSEVLA